MAADDLKKKSAARSGPLGSFDANETVRTWLRLANQSREGRPNEVHLQLKIDLKAVTGASGRTEERLFESLVTLVGTAAVESQLMLTCAKPGGGFGLGGGSVVTPPPAPADAAAMPSPDVDRAKAIDDTKPRRKASRRK